MYENYKLQFFQELTSCNYNLYFFEYSPEMKLLNSNCPRERLMDGFFMLNKCKELLKNYSGNLHRPVILSDSMGMMWAADFDLEDNTPAKIHVMGPAFINQVSLREIEHALNAHNMSIPLKRETLREFEQIPLITSTTFYQYTIMLHYCLHKEKIGFSDLVHLVSDKESQQTFSWNDKQTGKHLGISNVEQMILQSVEQGNLNYKSIMQLAGSRSSGVQANLGNSIQQSKYSCVTFVALCSRAAIRGGLPASTAYSLNDRYVELIDGCKTLGELASLNSMMMQDFTERVHNCRKNDSISVPVQTCCDYISMNVTRKFDISELAKQVGYSDYYLTRKFKKEMGVPLTTYIRTQKIEYAKTLLITTSMNVQDISILLHFGSRSYFAGVFQSETGMSPSEYREKNRRL